MRITGKLTVELQVESTGGIASEVDSWNGDWDRNGITVRSDS